MISHYKEWLGPEEWPTITPLERRQERMENLVTVSQAAEMLQVREEGDSFRLWPFQEATIG